MAARCPSFAKAAGDLVLDGELALAENLRNFPIGLTDAKPREDVAFTFTKGWSAATFRRWCGWF